MQVVITAVGPDNRGLADPIIHDVTGRGANISEIQMYDHDEQGLFAMLHRAGGRAIGSARAGPGGRGTHQATLDPRVVSRAACGGPRLAICTTYRMEPPLALLRALRDGQIKADAAVMLGNRPQCRSLAEQFGVDWHLVGDEKGNTDDEKLVALCDQYEVDYIILRGTCECSRRRLAGSTLVAGS